MDFFALHNPYKQSVCHVSAEPDPFPEQYMFNLPYRAISNDPTRHASEFWSDFITTAALNPYFENIPNIVFGAAWQNDDPKEILLHCAGDDSVGYDVGGLNTRFIIWAASLHATRPDAPFYGFTDEFGNVDPTCDDWAVNELGKTICHPLILTDGLPSGDALLSYPVNQANPSPDVIIQDFTNL